MTDFTYDVDADGVATIAWDQQGTSMNVMTVEGFSEFEKLFDRAIADEAVKGVVITSAKKDFAGGMDLKVLARIRDEAGDAPAQALFDFVMNGHRILRKVERNSMDPKTNRGGKPVAWACPGTSAGIGTEVGLACHRRFAANAKGAKIGLPEIMVGLFPGAGGTTRVARMMDILSASPILLEGKMMEPDRARMSGLIDEVVEPDELLSRAKAWVLEATDRDIVKPWDE